MDIFESMIKMFYFAQTTVTTIGFGDLHPVNSFERIIIVIFLLMGVLVQSIFMSQIVQKLMTFQETLLEFDESKQLSLFLKVIERFNNDDPYDPSGQKEKITHFFENRWKHNLNLALQEEQDKQTFDECPESVKQQIIMFLFSDFLQQWRYFFKLPNFETIKVNSKKREH